MLMVIVAVAFMTAVASSANGQSAQAVIANVPFEFKVGDKALPAGEYTVRAITAGGDALAIRSPNSGAVRLSQSIETLKASEKGKLVFHRYGDTYFLSQVWAPGERMGRQLLKSKGERTIEGQLAAIPSKSDRARSGYEVVEIVAIVR